MVKEKFNKVVEYLSDNWMEMVAGCVVASIVTLAIAGVAS
jgi:hypothetical protein